MLGEEAQLPGITRFVIAARYGLLALSCAIPIACIALLFTRDITRSIYWIGALGLLTVVQWLVIFYAISEPLMEVITKMQSPR